jgi:hypothetical protein
MTYLLLPRATGVVVATWPNYAGQLCRVAPTVKRATESSRLSTRCRQVGLRRLLSGWLVVGGGSYLESRVETVASLAICSMVSGVVPVEQATPALSMPYISPWY